MKAVVVEIKDGFAAVLSDDGQVVKVKNNNYETGQRIELRNPAAKVRRKLAALTAATAACVILGTGCWAYATPYTYVSVDVNPSIEYTLNRFDRVLAVKAVNEDGKAIIDEITLAKLKNKPIQSAIAATVDQITAAGYLEEASSRSIVITTSSENGKKAEALAADLQKTVEEKVSTSEKPVVVESYIAGSKDSSEAAKNDEVKKPVQDSKTGKDSKTEEDAKASKENNTNNPAGAWNNYLRNNPDYTWNSDSAWSNDTWNSFHSRSTGSAWNPYGSWYSYDKSNKSDQSKKSDNTSNRKSEDKTNTEENKKNTGKNDSKNTGKNDNKNNNSDNNVTISPYDIWSNAPDDNSYGFWYNSSGNNSYGSWYSIPGYNPYGSWYSIPDSSEKHEPKNTSTDNKNQSGNKQEDNHNGNSKDTAKNSNKKSHKNSKEASDKNSGKNSIGDSSKASNKNSNQNFGKNSNKDSYKKPSQNYSDYRFGFYGMWNSRK